MTHVKWVPPCGRQAPGMAVLGGYGTLSPRQRVGTWRGPGLHQGRGCFCLCVAGQAETTLWGGGRQVHAGGRLCRHGQAEEAKSWTQTQRSALKFRVGVHCIRGVSRFC